MFRKDYDKLLEVAPKELRDPIFFQSAYTDKGYYRPHSQMRNKATFAILETEGKDVVDFEQGVFLDIFPLDEVSKYSIIQRLKLRRLNFRKRLFVIRFKRTKAKNPLKQIVKIVIRKILQNFDYKKAYQRFEKICRKNLFRSDNYSKVSFYSKPELLKRSFNKSLFEKQIWVPFEDTTIPVPNGYDFILRKYYGDNYMQPKNIQSGHKIETLLVDREKI
jgi:lipopolysaccharide cholinephosphotransferase